MKTLSKILIAPLFVLFLLSCSSSSDPEAQADCGPDYCVKDLVGTWDATEYTLTFCGQGDIPEPSSFDVIAEGGSATLVVQSNGRFTLSAMIMVDGQTYPESISGKIFFEDEEFFAIQFDDDEPGDPTYFGDTLSGNTFRLIGGSSVAEWDFDGDETDEEACISMTFVKV